MGLTYHGQFNPPVDQILHERLRLPPTGLFVECGAFDGVADSNCLFLEEMGWAGINVEASPTLFEQLKRNRPCSTNVWAALSNTDGFAPFTRSVQGHEVGLGSLHPELIEYGRADVVSVPTVRWSTLCGGATPTLLSLDVEGHELIVLADLLETGPLPSYLVVEHGHVKEGPLHSLLTPRYNLLFRYEVNSVYERSDGTP